MTSSSEQLNTRSGGGAGYVRTVKLLKCGNRFGSERDHIPIQRHLFGRCEKVKNVMAERLVCLDTTVLIKYLTPDEQEEAATRIVQDALEDGTRIVAPTWAWAEVGSVLRKKMRAGLLLVTETDAIWEAFLDLPIDFIEMQTLRRRTWEIAAHYTLPTLYDAAFLAGTELVDAAPDAVREFWTADQALLVRLAIDRPAYVHQLV